MNNTMMNHTVPEGVVESRLERYAFDVFDEILPTRKSVRKAIKRGEIRVDGKICDPGFWIKPGQDVELHRLQTSTPRPFRFPLRIVFEDQWLAVVEKPPGFAVNGNRYRTVENMLLYNLNTSNQKDALRWPKPVHRLDNSTGGLMIAAKTHLSLVRLGWQFQGREVRKRYRAIVIGRLEGSGSIQYPLDGRNAETIFTAVEHVPSLKNGWVTLIDLWSRTGRTHQLRRHLSNLGFPILGDKLYGVEGEILRSKGLFLWGVEISFKHPISGSELSFRIKEADKFDSFLRREKRRWGKYH